MGMPFEISTSAGKDGATQIRFSGQLIINNIEKINGDLASKLAIDKALEVVIDNPENVDITFIQLIASLRKTWKASGLPFAVTATLKPDLVQLIEKSGLESQLK